MSFLERERTRIVEARDRLFRDSGSGVFAGTPRGFVLEDADGNLWDGVRRDALGYFASQGIAWWKGEGEGPTGHLLSSQVACVNHLFALRQRRDAATALLRGLDGEVEGAEVIEDGLVAFEFIGPKPRLGERSFSRGSHSTSVDAAMIGRLRDGSRRLFLIEWKYTEAYRSEDKHIPARAEVYDRWILDQESPFTAGLDPRALYYEPFYQMMRQTLLGWLIVRHGDLGCSSFRHVHVVPEGNREFHDRVTSPGLSGRTVTEAWGRVLKEPQHYLPVTPEELLAPVATCPDTASHLGYLRDRYWA